jgi:hypothetical protein
MAEWTEKELEELMATMTQKSMTDAEFRKEVLEDATKALEKLAGKALPRGSSLKCIEKDPNYQTTLVLPDLLDEERLDDESLVNVAGGISIALIVEVCGAAVSAGPEVIPSACGARACPADACYADACGAHACAAKGGGLAACGTEACSAQACTTKTGETYTKPEGCTYLLKG